MQLIPISDIVVMKRQRRKIEAAPLLELQQSIRERTLLHPPVVWLDPATQKYELVVGERRFRAVEAMAKSGTDFWHAGQPVPRGFIPVTPLGDVLSGEGRFAAELEENTHRVDLTWQERCEALSELHTMRQEVNLAQTFRNTAEELVAKKAMTSPITGTPTESVKRSVLLIKQAVVVAAALANPKISGARNATEAFNLVLKLEEDRINAAIARKQLTRMENAPDVEVRKGCLLEVLPTLEAGTFDLILADPPYGIDASGGGFRSRTVQHHNYSDTPEDAWQLAQAILTEGFRLCKPRANLLMFTDIKHWDWLQRVAANMGWDPFRRPLIWGKSDSEGLAPWGSRGPRITTELIFFATKGGRGMVSSPIDYISEKRVPRHEREHAAEKPEALIRYLIECTTLPGDSVLDPCCGSGTTLVAARAAKRTGLGLEKDPDYFELALARVHGRITTNV